MTNDSGLFKRRDELETAGFYPTGGNHWKKGDEEFVPLYEGKMVQMYDHRAANIVINPENLHRPAQPEPASEEQHADSSWLPEPQFWVSGQYLELLTRACDLNREQFQKLLSATAVASRYHTTGTR